MKTWNFGIIGAGLISDFHAMAISDIPNARLIAVCDTSPRPLKKMADKYSVDAFSDYKLMLQKKGLDIVTIATPSGAHMEPTIAAAQADKHVICEKPIEITLKRIDAMIDAHEKAGTYLGCVFQNRYTDAMIPLREAITKGRFGTITYVGVYVPWWRTDEYYNGSWHGTWKMDGGGALMNQSIHMIDMLCDLMPPVESLQALTATLAHPQMEAEDTAAAILRFANGAIGIIYGTTSSYPGQLKRFEITGTKGTVIYLEDSFTVWQFAEENPKDEEIRQKFGQIEGPGSVADPSAITHQNHTRNFADFIESIETGKKLKLDGREGRKAVKLILDIYEAAKTKIATHQKLK